MIRSLGILFFLKTVLCFKSITHTEYDSKSIEEKRQFFRDNFDKNHNKYDFRLNYINFCRLVGDYDEVIEKIGPTNTRIKNYFLNLKDKLKNGNENDLLSLRFNSGLCKELLIKILNNRIKNKDFNQYCNEITTLIKTYSDDKTVAMICAHYLFLCSSFFKAIKLLDSIERRDITSAFLSIYNRYNEIKSEKSTFYKISYLKNYFELLTKECDADTFQPSIYSSFRIFVLKEYVVMAVDYKKTDASESAKILYEYKVDDFSCFYYIMSYLLEGKNDEALEIFTKHNWRDSSYKTAISKKLGTLNSSL